MDYANSSLSKEHAAKETANQKVKDLEAKIDQMGGKTGEGYTIVDENDKDGVPWGKMKLGNDIVDIDKDILTSTAKHYQGRAAVWQNRVNTLQSIGAFGQVVAGSFQLAAAYAQQDAEFLRAEAQLTDAFRNFSAAMVQNIDSSAQQALQQMDKLVSSLKEVFRAMYDIECSIARNI